MLRVQRLQAFGGNVGIDLGRRNVAVTQQHLHHAQIGAVIEQVGGKGMPERMRRQCHTNPGFSGVLLDQMPESLATHRTAPPGGK